MAKRKPVRKIANTKADPTLRTTEITLNGKVYTLCFDMGALAEAEMHFREAGYSVNLLKAFPEVTLSSVLILFPCAVHKFHPELDFVEAQKLIMSNMAAIYAIGPFIVAAWAQSVPQQAEGEKADSETPQKP